MKPSPKLKRKAVKFANNSVILKSERLDQMIKSNAPLNNIRHSASNYDRVCEGANLLESEKANAFVHASQNLVNKLIDQARVEHVDSLQNEIAELKAQVALLQADVVIAQAEETVAQVDEYIVVKGGKEYFVW